jgi:uncharacterized protein
MNKRQLIKKTEEYVKKTMLGESTGHDWWHVYRVLKTARLIAKKEKADMFIVELAALLHDLDDWKFCKNNSDEPIKAIEWLEKNKVPEKDASHIIGIIKNMSFKGGTVKAIIATIEGKAIQDADRLDALGAIGIARTFATGSRLGREIYNPSIRPIKYQNFTQMKKSKSTSINHFYEKNLLLKDLMNTKTGKKIAKKRHHFMEEYLAEFYKEWDGIK